MLQTSALDAYGAGAKLSIYQDDSLASAHAAEQLVSAGSMPTPRLTNTANRASLLINGE